MLHYVLIAIVSMVVASTAEIEGMTPLMLLLATGLGLLLIVQLFLWLFKRDKSRSKKGKGHKKGKKRNASTYQCPKCREPRGYNSLVCPHCAYIFVERRNRRHHDDNDNDRDYDSDSGGSDLID